MIQRYTRRFFLTFFLICNCGQADPLETKQELKDLEPSDYVTIVITVPETHANAMREALGRAGTGKFGNYTDCSYSVKGIARFRPNKDAKPYMGKEGVIEEVVEERIETVCKRSILEHVLEEIKKAHPYEETVIDIYPVYKMGIKKPALESRSENNGIKLLSDRDEKIYSVGISTGGCAEVRMAKEQKMRHIIATTIDSEGAAFAKQRIKELGFSDQIEVKVEDVSQPLPYSEGCFDYIYARLVLHYLPKEELTNALRELYRTLRTGGKLFVVVRSTDCLEAKSKEATFDPETCLTTYFSEGKSYSRYFHTEKSIAQYLTQAGFTLASIKEYQEQLCVDFQRKQLSNQIDTLIEVLAVK